MNEITAKEIEKKLAADEKINIIDVREDAEVMMGTIPGAVHIPLGEVPHQFESLNQDKNYYILCRSGGRSGKATEFLSKKGYDVTNIKGGILAWEGELDTDL